MSRFEFFMAFYGLLLGLGVAELLGAFANLLRERTPPRIGLLTPMLGLLILVEMIANFIDAWVKFQDIQITLPGLALPTLIGLIYYVLAVVAVPRDLSDWPDLDDYAASRRRFLVGGLIVANLLINLLEISRLDRTMTATVDGVRSFALLNLWLLGSYAVLFVTRRRWLQTIAAGAVLVFYGYVYGYVILTLPH